MMDTTSTSAIVEQIKEESNRFHSLDIEISKVIVGQKNAVDFVINAILCNGHILLEGVPGVAKTTMIKSAAKALGLTFNRIQFTPDLLPADLIGTLIYNPKKQEFETRKGPIFANLILADEINRAPAKVQSALLEAMQEQQVTIGLQTFKIDKPFLVFATQNPIEQEGTYRLPEAQLDRFMFKIIVNYPDKQEERTLLKRSLDTDMVQQILQRDIILATQKLVNNVFVDEKIIDYMVNIIFATRNPVGAGLEEINSYIRYGVSPRATLALYHASKGYAFLKNRHFVVPDDVKKVCPMVLRHRLILSYEAEADNIKPDHLIEKILAVVTTP